ncbi:MAG: FHA domain-containing protein [Bdellovibrionaceae bacterium]|nr:FHA domain-containing protein [Pseudobdellovibrionaceae bacterium]
MWSLRVLSGPQAGSVHGLKLGRNLIGRGATCDIKINSSGVSKEHAEIHVYKDKILVVDLRSSNGTYLNGIKVQNGLVRLGDKMSIHDVILDIIPAAEKAAPAANAPAVTAANMNPAYGAPPPLYNHQQMPYPPPMHGGEGEVRAAPVLQAPQGPLKGLLTSFEDYMNRVALPGVYKMAEVLEFKMVLATFLVVFVFAVTLLSMIPMVQITRASITQESMRRASSLARTLARVNQQALLQGSYSALSTHDVETEDGVKRALIVQQSDGVILAPASQSGNSPDLPFVVSARRETKAQAQQIDDSTIGASFPIGMYDPNTGEPIVKAHAIILYDIGSLAFDDGRALSLFFQTLVIASLLGLALFYFMYKLIEYPMVSLNEQLDTAMREKRDNLEVKFMFPALQSLIGNLNSLLTRYIHGDAEGGGGGGVFANKDTEAANLLHLIGFPAVAVRADHSVIGCNQGFEQIARNTSAMMMNQTLDSIKDAALRQNIEHLLGKAREVPSSIHSDQLDFSGHLCAINCQAVSTSETVDYFLISIVPSEGGG